MHGPGASIAKSQPSPRRERLPRLDRCRLVQGVPHKRREIQRNAHNVRRIDAIVLISPQSSSPRISVEAQRAPNETVENVSESVSCTFFAATRGLRAEQNETSTGLTK